MPPRDKEQTTSLSSTSRIEWCIRDFEAAWGRGERPEISDYLSRVEGSGTDLLLELVHADLEFRLRAGEPARVEEYLHRYPGLAEDVEALMDLLAAEYEYRKRGVGLTIEEYLERFPQLRPELLVALAGATVLRDATPLRGPPGDRNIDRFELIDRLGRGASGTVYSARDPILRRMVALKVLDSGRVEDRERFLREARSVAPLTHPGIVPLLEAGWTDECWFLAYEYVQGKTLSELAAGGPPDLSGCAELIALVADALDYAHQNGIIHRDVKPSNILLSSDGVPRLTDFGLARGLSDTTLTAEGQILGTPAYMSPEQARGQAASVDARSDVYSLGVVLFHLLTGELPFRGSPVMVLDQVLHEDPPHPRSLNERIPRDLSSIVLKAMNKSPADRYASAGDLAADLRRFLQGRPVTARPPSQVVRLLRHCRRHPVVCSLLAAVLMVVALGFAGVTWEWRQAELQRQQTEAYLAETVRQRNEMRADFERAHATISTLLTQLKDNYTLRNPASKAAFLRSLELCLAYYQGSTQDDSDPGPKQFSKMVSALSMSAEIQSELGRSTEAIRSRRRAVELQEQVVAARPSSLDQAKTLAFELSALGHVLFKAGHKEEAMKHARRAAVVARQAFEDHPARADIRHAYAQVLLRLGRYLWGTTRPPEALAKVLVASRLQESLVSSHNRADYREGLAEASYYAAEIHRDRGEWAAALRHALRATELYDSLLREKPDSFQYIRPLGNSVYLVGWAQRTGSKKRAAANSYASAAVYFSRLALTNPADPQVLWNLAFAHRNAAGMYFQVGERDAALAAVGKSIVSWERLCRDYPEDSRYAKMLEKTRRERDAYLTHR